MNQRPLPRKRLVCVYWMRIGTFTLLTLHCVGRVNAPWNFQVKRQQTNASLEPLPPQIKP